MTQTGVSAEFATKHFVEAGRARVGYHKAGSGPALVLLHGFPLSGLTWRKVVPTLAQCFTCYALDLVGLGGTMSPVASDFSSQGQGAVFQRALAALGVSSYTLVGNDTGGWVARELALLEPEKIEHLVLTNTEIPGHRPPWIPLYQTLSGLPGAGWLFRRVLSSRAMRRSPMGFGGCFTDPDIMDGEFFELFVTPLLADPNRIASMQQFLVQMKFVRLDEFARLHGRLPMPVSFVWGAADPTFPEVRARAMRSQFPCVAGFETIAGGKLFIQEEFPDRVAALTLDTLRRRG